jgi:restriction system protein
MEFTKLWSQLTNLVRLFGSHRHIRNIATSKRLLSKIREIARQGGGRAMVYLRKVDPSVFEELILTVIENSNVRVIRNKAYSGDGGIDGTFTIGGEKYIIQCKRYSSHINPAHVAEFSQNVKLHQCQKGIFVHTGKTGPMSKSFGRESGEIVFISGEKLIRFIAGDLHITGILK